MVMKTVKEVSKLTGISIRTLHHYDAIGLLKPTQVTEAGYRLYDSKALERLQAILLFRELQFPLKEIGRILDSPGFDPVSALEQQIKLLQLQRERLDALIAHAQNLQKKGEWIMNFESFDRSKVDRYAAQAKEKWGKTDAYREFEQKTKDQTPEQLQNTGDSLMAIFAEIGEKKHLAPEAEEVQALIRKLQNFITDHYYTCTPQILRGLGQMYIAGDSMTENIDHAGGPGTAEFTNRAIQVYTA